MSILAEIGKLIEVAMILLALAQNPQLPLESRQQSLQSAKQTVEQVSVQLASMQNSSSTPSEEPVAPQPVTAPQAPAPAPANNPTPATPPTEPVLGSTQPVNPYAVEILESPRRTGGTIVFKATKNNAPLSVIDKLTGNIINQIFIRLPEDLPPGRGIFHIYIPEQSEEVENPSLDLVIEGVSVKVPVTFAQ
jgi:hypothetical protein